MFRKRILSVLLTGIMLLGMSTSVFASEPSNGVGGNSEHQEYLQYVSDGILSSDITFEYWKQLKDQSVQLESVLENTDNFSEVYGRDTYSMKNGDVFITNGTSSAGILGHAGIAISSTRIIHIAGFGDVPEVISLATWNSLYDHKGWTKVYRSSNSTVATNAGDWADTTYRDSNAEYVIGTNLASTDETYCSKMVWQAYYYGTADEHHANGPAFGVRLPYDLDVTIHDLSFEKKFSK